MTQPVRIDCHATANVVSIKDDNLRHIGRLSTGS